jgi:hypothetical protein
MDFRWENASLPVFPEFSLRQALDRGPGIAYWSPELVAALKICASMDLNAQNDGSESKFGDRLKTFLSCFLVHSPSRIGDCIDETFVFEVVFWRRFGTQCLDHIYGGIQLFGSPRGSR